MRLNVEILPILRTQRRNGLAATLIGLQIALTLAIICNCLSVIQQRLQQMRRSTGIDEANIFTFRNTWVGDPKDLKARIEGDLTALRSLPGVIDAEATNSFPLSGYGWGTGMGLKPDQQRPSVYTLQYFVDQHALATYGVSLIAGRWFSADEVSDTSSREAKFPATIVITETLAKSLFASGNALGKVLYFRADADARIVGITSSFQTSGATSGGQSFDGNSIFVPFQLLNNGINYVVRTKPGQLAKVMRAAPVTLDRLTRRRIMDGIRPFAETRRRAYRQQRTTAIMLGVLCTLLLAVAALGLIGVTMYWVTQRRRHIGMRRALGARRLDILKYFHTENFIIAGVGGVLGIAAGLAGNIWLASALEITRMSFAYVCIGALTALALCQAAVIWPALRAASISPASAIRDL